MRSLQSACLKHFHTTLTEYLRQRRLETARAELLSPSNSREIWEIAQGLQFRHLSRFAQAYRRQFGELPSTTRKLPPRYHAQEKLKSSLKLSQ